MHSLLNLGALGNIGGLGGAGKFVPLVNKFSINLNSAPSIIAVSAAGLPLAADLRTIAFWYKPNSQSALRYICSYGTNATLQEFSLFDDNGTLKFDRFGGSINTGKTINNGQWNFITATFDGTNVRFSCNGSFTGNSALAINTSSANNFTIGRRAFFGAGQADGKFDLVRVWDGLVLSDSEIGQLYAGTAVPQSASMVLEWLLDEATGTTATDTSGGGNNGLITGGTWVADAPL